MNADTPTVARHLLAQHPDPWTAGAWYPATLPDGRVVTIRRTRQVGRGTPFLHIRGDGWHIRLNLMDGTGVRLS